MKLNGKIIKGTKILKDLTIELNDENKKFHELLETCLILLCKDLDISVPLWLEKNTKEFARHRKTGFSNDQFVEDIDFDRFEIKIFM